MISNCPQGVPAPAAGQHGTPPPRHRRAEYPDKFEKEKELIMKANRNYLLLITALVLCIGLTACAVLAKPKNITGAASDTHTLTLSWDAVEGATGYRIAISRPGSETELTRLEVSQNHATLTDVPYSSAGYHATVTALQEKDGKEKESGVSEALVIPPAKPTVSAVKGLLAQTTPDGTVLLSWDAATAQNHNVDGSAAGILYEVWCSDTAEGESRLLASDITDPHYVDREVSSPRYYKVRVLEVIDGEKAEGALSEETASVMLLSQPVAGLKAESDGSAAVLTWEAYNASGASVTYRVSQGDTVLAENLAECTYRHEALSDLTTYDYQVVAVCALSGSTGITPNAEATVTMPLSPLPGVSASSANTSSIDIKWGQSPVAALKPDASVSVNVYTASSADGNFTLLAEKLTQQSFRHGDLSSGSTHFYRVEVVVTLDGAQYKAMSDTVKATVMVPVSDEPFMGTEWICDHAFLLYQGAAHQMSGFNKGNATKLAAIYDAYAGIFPDTRVSVVVGPISSIIITPDQVKGIPNQGLDKNAALQTDRVNFVNLNQTFLDHRDEYLFFRSDHHWTHRGAYYAYAQFAQSIGLQPRPIDDFEVKILNTKMLGSMVKYTKDARVKKFYDTVEAYMPSKACTMTYNGTTKNYCINTSAKNYMAFINGDIAYAEITVPENPQDMIALVIKDSYGNAFVPYLTEHYGKIYVIDPRKADFTLQQKFAGITFDDIIFAYNNYSANSGAWVGFLNRLIGR